ncbi:MAG: hypothetical protein AMJ88_02885 [Anaerolineae bacterium SM23_ 63]|nr:MAG: hypothetical protein AMJ88_02885 [Anaerolineae bacterium SM23_ 63]HEY46967.1 hypothetical protein [Anaerolineae bacterium]
MESRELSTLKKAEKLIALLKEDEELREMLKSDRPEVRQEVLEKVDLNAEEMEDFLSALDAISAKSLAPGFWG